MGRVARAVRILLRVTEIVNAPFGSGSSLDKLALGVGLVSGFVALVGAVLAVGKCWHRNVS
jgi:hypothetical protein